MKKILDHSKITLLFDIKNVARLLLQKILNEINSTKGLILFYNHKKNSYNIVEYTGFSARLFSELNIDFQFLNTINKNISITAKSNIPAFSIINEKLAAGALEEITASPIIIAGKKIGFLILLIENKARINCDIFTICDNHIKIFAANISADLLNKIGDFDMFDPTTAIYNQDFLYENLYRKILEAERSNSKFGLALIEIKNFKDITVERQETAQHILKSLSSFLKSNLRKIDILAMLYNTIISIIFPDMDNTKVINKLEELKVKLKITGLKDENDELLPQIEIGYGIAVYPESGKNCELLIRNAIKSIN